MTNMNQLNKSPLLLTTSTVSPIINQQQQNDDIDRQSTTSNIVVVDDDDGGGGGCGRIGNVELTTNMNTTVMTHPLSMPIAICSMSPPFSSQNADLNISCHPNDTVQCPLYDIYDPNKNNANVIDPERTPVPPNRNKKFSFSSTTSVSDSGTESIVDEEYPTLAPDANEKILDFFARDNSKTVKLARRRLSANYREVFKSQTNSDDEYDSDDESTLSESSFSQSPTEYGTPRSEAIFDFDKVCAAIDEKLVKRDENLMNQDEQNAIKHNDDDSQSERERTISENEQQFNNMLEELCDNSKDRRNQAILTRSTSLKSGKTPPGTPGRKKIVRFADAMGLDLASVRHIVYDVPYVPPIEAFKSLQLDDEDRNWLLQTHSDANPFKIQIPNLMNPGACNEMNTTLKMLFGQPSSDPINFLERVRSNKVCLENCILSGPSGPGQVYTITCLVRVLNICFQKKVVLRYTTNEWLTWNEVPGTYVNNSNDGFSDKFTVKLEIAVNANGHQVMMPGQRLLFAIRYLTDESDEHWDNNVGMNYALIYQRC